MPASKVSLLAADNNPSAAYRAISPRSAMTLFHLPRTMHMRIMLGLGMLQLFVVSLFSTYMVVREVGEELTNRQAAAHKILSLTAPSVERLLARGERAELDRFMRRVAADPVISRIEIKGPTDTVLYRHDNTNEPPHQVARWFRLGAVDQGLSTQIWRDGTSLGVMTISLSNRPINDSITELLNNMSYLLFVLLALDLIATQIILHFFIAPLGPLAEMAREFTQGKISTTIAPELPGQTEEVQDLTQAFVKSAELMRRQIDDLESTRTRLAQNELRLRNLVNNMHEALVELDATGKILFLNPMWQRLTGYSVEECLNSPFPQFLVQASQQAHFVFGRVERVPTYDFQIEVRARDGRSVWLRMNTTLQYDTRGEFVGTVSTLEDVTENLKLQRLQREHEQDLYRLSITDPLTGVANRRHFDDTLANLLAVNLGKARQVALIILDIDGFKFINDTYGHPVGDEVLKSVAARLSADRREGLVARLAGDEFAVVLPNVSEEHAHDVAKAIHQGLSGITIRLPVGQLRIQTSVGVAVAPAFGKTPQDLVRAADVALYHAKKSGRNRVDVLSHDMGDAIMDIFSQGFELRNALNNGMIAPFIQPIFDIQKNELMAYEVLTRLKRGNEYVVADEFVLIAEDLGLIREMDLFIIERALAIVPKGVHLFVNISMSAFQTPEFYDDFRALMQSPPAQGREVTIEITERQTIEMTEAFFDLLNDLRASGIRIALDDFGAGYSTYAYLRKLKPDFVKIDGSFVQQMLNDVHDHKIVEQIRELSTAFGARSIAEHVEDAKTLAVLRALGVEYAQGYYFGKPKMIEEYLSGAGAIGVRLG